MKALLIYASLLKLLLYIGKQKISSLGSAVWIVWTEANGGNNWRRIWGEEKNFLDSLWVFDVNDVLVFYTVRNYSCLGKYK